MAREMSEGRRQLLEALQRTTTIEIAMRCGVTHQAVSHWASGLCQPSERSQAMMREHCWIEGDWHVERVYRFKRALRTVHQTNRAL